MSSRSSYGASYAQDKGAYGQRSSSSASSYINTSSSVYSQSSHNRYSNKPPAIHNGGGPINDPNTSTSAPNAGYYN